MESTELLIRRRSLLKLLAASSAIPFLPERASAIPPSTVIVVGAGYAGLSAARSLADAGVDVIVLEARSRIGGRAWTSSVSAARRKTVPPR